MNITARVGPSAGRVPRLIPVVGPTLELLRGRPWQTLLRWNQEHGRVVEVRLLGKRCYVVSDPGLIQRVMSTRMKNYPKSELGYDAFRPLLGQGLVLASGEDWRRQRTTLNRAFRTEILDEIVEISLSAADRLIQRLDGEIVDMSEAFRSLTLQVISRAVTSLPPDVCESVFPRLFVPAVEEINKRIWAPYRAWMPTRSRARFNRAIGELDDFLQGVVTQRWDATVIREEPDILDRIVTGFRADGMERGSVIPMIRDQIKTFIFAGHETTSMMLTWAVHELTRRPELAAQVRAEADELLDGSAVNTGDLKGLRWTDAVLKEALRYYSLVPVLSRQVLEDDEYEGVQLRAGAIVAISIIGAHNDVDAWGDPEAFRPQRFFEPLKVPWAYLPFARGPRNCVGENFAMVEAKLVLARLIQRLDISPAPDTEVVPEPRDVPTGPVGGLPVRVLARVAGS